MRFHKHARRRDHRKLSLLVETRAATEKCIYDWRLDTSRVADVSAGRKMVHSTPPDTAFVSMDPAYDSRDMYDAVETHGARPVIKPRANARTTQINARGRAIRRRLRYKSRWQNEYNERPITESVNYALKRRFGDRLWTRGIRRQRKEMGLRVLVYNTNMVHRMELRIRLSRRD